MKNLMHTGRSMDPDSNLRLLNPERTVEIVLAALHELVEYELAVVLSYEEGRKLRVKKADGPLSSYKLEDFTISLEDRKDIASLINHKEPYLFSEDEEHIDTYAGVVDLPAGHSCLVSPLYLDDRLLGMLTLDHRTCNMFTPQVVNLIRTLSKLISLALAQAENTLILDQQKADLIRQRNNLLPSEEGAFQQLIGSSPAWESVKDAIRLAASSDIPVLLTGETGTGKEMAARTIHNLSRRAGNPFIALNCSALSSGVVESELFGHEKGAFTGAQYRRKGRFELADSGTLLLDEIGDLPIDIQPKLLRVIQEGLFERLGGEKSVKTDARLIAATHIDMGNAVQEGQFREDLFYRLSVFPIHLPPLRERGDDVLLLADHFAQTIRKRAGFEQVSLSDEALYRIRELSWEGNVRQLRNAVERAALLARGGEIRAAHIVADAGSGSLMQPGNYDHSQRQAAVNRYEKHEQQSKQKEQEVQNEQDDQNGLSRKIAPLETAVREHIIAALRTAGGKIYGPGGAAELLDMKPSTLQSRMKRLGIDKNDFV